MPLKTLTLKKLCINIRQKIHKKIIFLHTTDKVLKNNYIKKNCNNCIIIDCTFMKNKYKYIGIYFNYPHLCSTRF